MVKSNGDGEVARMAVLVYLNQRDCVCVSVRHVGRPWLLPGPGRVWVGAQATTPCAKTAARGCRSLGVVRWPGLGRPARGRRGAGRDSANRTEESAEYLFQVLNFHEHTALF